MLNRAKVLQELQAVQQSLFLDLSSEILCAKQAWVALCADPLFALKCVQAQSNWLVPCWHEALETVISIEPFEGPYEILALDGSQIYPDKHQGTSCFLVNIGSVVLRYGYKGSIPVVLHSQPYVFLPEDAGDLNPMDVVNCKRQELELNDAITCVQQMRNVVQEKPTVFLFDGSLIFWHLEGKGSGIKERFLSPYIAVLDYFYQQRILLAGYISLPKSKELINLIRLWLCDFQPDDNDAHKKVEHLVDAHIASSFLKPGQRSIVFASTSSIVQWYPESLRPYFCYLHVGDEVVRLEFPAWIAKNPELVNKICSCILDQTGKGSGYPVCLAEAHEQAVVKGPDREFFYQCIERLGMKLNKKISLSQKRAKKRRIGI